MVWYMRLIIESCWGGQESLAETATHTNVADPLNLTWIMPA